MGAGDGVMEVFAGGEGKEAVLLSPDDLDRTAHRTEPWHIVLFPVGDMLERRPERAGLAVVLTETVGSFDHRRSDQAAVRHQPTEELLKSPPAQEMIAELKEPPEIPLMQTPQVTVLEVREQSSRES